MSADAATLESADVLAPGSADFTARDKSAFATHGMFTAADQQEPAEATPAEAAPVESEPSTEPAEPAQPAKPEQPEADEFDAELLAEAGKYGFSADESRSFGSRQNLETALAAQDRQLAALGRGELNALTESDEVNGQVRQQQPQQSPSDAARPFDKFKLELDPAEYDEPQIKALNGLNDHYDNIARKQDEYLRQQAEVIASLDDQLNQITGHFRAEASTRNERDLDTFFTSLGDGFGDLFGKGEMRLLNQGGNEAKNRNALVEEMSALRIADAKLNRPTSTTSQLAQRALRSLHGDRLKTLARKDIEDKLAQRRSQTIEQPRSRSDSAAGGTPEERAARIAESIQRKAGVYDE